MGVLQVKKGKVSGKVLERLKRGEEVTDIRSAVSLRRR